jgi:hypothetical protein
MGQTRWAGASTARKSTVLARPGPIVVPCLGLYVSPQCRHGTTRFMGRHEKGPLKPSTYLQPTAHRNIKILIFFLSSPLPPLSTPAVAAPNSCP